MPFCFPVPPGGAAARDIAHYPKGFFLNPDFDIPTDFNDPGNYRRGASEDWEWAQEPIGVPFTSAKLCIDAHDIDSPHEQNKISVFDTDSAAWVLLGDVTGKNDEWSYGCFDLDSSLHNEIGAGLRVAIDIDTNENDSGNWFVTLAKSAISVDGASLPAPGPENLPEPNTLSMIGFGLLGVMGFSRRSRNSDSEA